MPKLSLIIPVYNVEKYLRECLDSCINQTLKDIEIICINDCSPDDSYKILEEYSKKDNRVKIINHEGNKGLGAARNTGVASATGEYIWFIDSDDFIDINSCQLFYDVAKENDVDILLFQGKDFVDENEVKRYLTPSYYNDLPKNKVINLKTYKYKNEFIPVSACMYISKLNFIKNFSFRTGVYYEDTDFTPILFWSANNIMSICYSAYNRRLTPGSITQTSITEKKLLDKISVVKSLKTFIKCNDVSKNRHLYIFFISFRNYVCTEIEKNISVFDVNNCDYMQIKHETNSYNNLIRKSLGLLKYFIPYGIIRFFQR